MDYGDNFRFCLCCKNWEGTVQNYRFLVKKAFAKQFRCTQFREYCFLVRNYSSILRNKMAQAEAIIARNSVQRNSV